MKYFALLLLGSFISIFCFAQNPLPPKMYAAMRDSTTSMDVVFMQGKGRSLSLDGRNVHLFNSFFENKATAKSQTELAGSIMWLINGREFLSGKFFLNDSTGYVVIDKEGKEYVNLINAQGTSFFKSQIKE